MTALEAMGVGKPSSTLFFLILETANPAEAAQSIPSSEQKLSELPVVTACLVDRTK